ncbi:Unknown protein [Striga hermonthica]|uniref:RNase H type-1 domain-containing protein n=1 Tax=Striga hermonthica TaxID=68872 RepID=A0A9N7MS40_STRHE|nr:Unknown protein [Striga hermonthica]
MEHRGRNPNGTAVGQISLFVSACQFPEGDGGFGGVMESVENSMQWKAKGESTNNKEEANLKAVRWALKKITANTNSRILCHVDSLITAEVLNEQRVVDSEVQSIADEVVKLMQCFVKEIKDGLTTKVLSDPWVPSLSNGIPLVAADAQISESLKVADLLEDGGRSWDANVIRRIFTPHSAEAILKIKSMDPAKRDRWNWSGDPKGLFSISSAYAKAMVKKVLGLDSPQSSNAGSKDKEARLRCWKLRVKVKLRHFLWKGLIETPPNFLCMRASGVARKGCLRRLLAMLGGR